MTIIVPPPKMSLKKYSQNASGDRTQTGNLALPLPHGGQEDCPGQSHDRRHDHRQHHLHCDHHQVGVGVYYPSGQTTICVDARPLTEPLRPIDVSTGHRQNHHHYYQMHNGHHTIVISWPVPDLCCQVLLYAPPKYFAELESEEEEDGACITLFTK